MQKVHGRKVTETTFTCENAKLRKGNRNKVTKRHASEHCHALTLSALVASATVAREGAVSEPLSTSSRRRCCHGYQTPPWRRRPWPLASRYRAVALTWSRWWWEAGWPGETGERATQRGCRGQKQSTDGHGCS